MRDIIKRSAKKLKVMVRWQIGKGISGIEYKNAF